MFLSKWRFIYNPHILVISVSGANIKLAFYQNILKKKKQIWYFLAQILPSYLSFQNQSIWTLGHSPLYSDPMGKRAKFSEVLTILRAQVRPPVLLTFLAHWTQ